MERHVMWIPTGKPGLEHLKLVELPKRVTVSSLLIGLAAAPYRVHYEIGCDSHWRVRRIDIQQLDLPTEHAVYLVTDGSGHWATADGEPLPEYDGCLDVDISVTPFTNTLPIRRLDLKTGDSANVRALYITVPEMKMSVAEHVYSCIERRDTGGIYRFESLTTSFSAQLTTDRDGVVIEYPGIFQRVLPDGGH